MVLSRPVPQNEEGGMAVPAVWALASFSKSVLYWTTEQKPHTGGTPVPLSFSCKQDSIGRGACASLVSDLVHPVTMLNSTLINSEM